MSDEWIEWHGGGRPVAIGTAVQVRFRGRIAREDGSAYSGDADDWNWIHRRRSDDIIAYRVLPPHAA